MALSSIPLEGNWALESAFGGSLRITQLISVSHHTWGITFGMPCHLVQYKLLAWPHVITAVCALVCHAMLYNHHPWALLCHAWTYNGYWEVQYTLSLCHTLGVGAVVNHALIPHQP